MPDFYGAHFKFGTRSSKQFNLVFANLNTSRYMNLYGDVSGLTIFNRGDRKRYLIGDDYSNSPLSIDLEIVTKDGSAIPESSLRTVEQWLFKSRNYQRMYILLDDNTEPENLTQEIIDADPYGAFYEYNPRYPRMTGAPHQLFLNCRFNNPERIEYDCRVVGYKATLEADTHMWMQDNTAANYTRPLDLTTDYWQFPVFVDTDLPGYTYPWFYFRAGTTGGTITVYNLSDDAARATQFINVAPNDTVQIGSDVNFVGNGYYPNFVGTNFPRFRNGENQLKLEGDVATAGFAFNNRRFL